VTLQRVDNTGAARIRSGSRRAPRCAYNLAWKLALVVKGAARESLLDSYEAERRPVGAEVVARTRAASENYGRERGGRPDDRADTQIGISYRGTPWVRDDAPDFAATRPAAGDRAPDAGGLRRRGLGFPLRLFDILRGTEHVLVAHLAEADASAKIADLAARTREILSRRGSYLRIVAVAAADGLPDHPGIASFDDQEARLAAAYGSPEATFLIRPDGYIGWRGRSWREAGLVAYLDLILPPDSTGP